MDNIKKQIQTAIQRPKDSAKLSTVSQGNILKVGSKTFLKTTTGDLTKEGGTEAIGKLASNFKKLDNSFYSILIQRARVNGFDDTMLNNAIDSVIDNFVYAEPKVADILQINSNVELFNYHEVVIMNDKMDRKAFEYYRPVKVPGLSKPMYASINDIEKYSLEYFPIKGE